MTNDVFSNAALDLDPRRTQGWVLEDAARDLMFRKARTFNDFADRPVDPSLLKQAYDLAKMGPTSANCQPLRTIFVVSADAKKKLEPALSPTNRDKTMRAPATAIFAYDVQFYETLHRTFPHTDARSWFVGKPDLIQETAFRNATLQAAYFMLALRAVGLDCGPMSGFDQAKVNEAFFAGTSWRANFICNIGYGTSKDLFPRNPRLGFDETCRID